MTGNVVKIHPFHRLSIDGLIDRAIAQPMDTAGLIESLANCDPDYPYPNEFAVYYHLGMIAIASRIFDDDQRTRLLKSLKTEPIEFWKEHRVLDYIGIKRKHGRASCP